MPETVTRVKPAAEGFAQEHWADLPERTRAAIRFAKLTHTDSARALLNGLRSRWPDLVPEELATICEIGLRHLGSQRRLLNDARELVLRERGGRR
jgi:hypothetical protein